MPVRGRLIRHVPGANNEATSCGPKYSGGLLVRGRLFIRPACLFTGLWLTLLIATEPHQRNWTTYSYNRSASRLAERHRAHFFRKEKLLKDLKNKNIFY